MKDELLNILYTKSYFSLDELYAYIALMRTHFENYLPYSDEMILSELKEMEKERSIIMMVVNEKYIIIRV